MSRCPLTAFMTEAYLAARHARLGRLTMGMKLKLACVGVALPEGHMPAREAVARFIDVVDADPVSASMALDNFMWNWVIDVFEPKIIGIDLAQDADESVDGEFDWQRRKDCGHG